MSRLDDQRSHRPSPRAHLAWINTGASHTTSLNNDDAGDCTGYPRLKIISRLSCTKYATCVEGGGARELHGPHGDGVNPATMTTTLGGHAGADELGGLLGYLW
jgi:hypothetical protein